MNSATLFRIGLYLFAVYTLFYALTQGSYYLVSYLGLSDSSSDIFIQATVSEVVFSFGVPLMFSFGILGFAGAITRVLLGGQSGAEEADFDAANSFFYVGLKLLGVYSVLNHAPGICSYVVEALVANTSNPTGTDYNLSANASYHIVGFVLGLVLVTKTRALETWLANR